MAYDAACIYTLGRPSLVVLVEYLAFAALALKRIEVALPKCPRVVLQRHHRPLGADGLLRDSVAMGVARGRGVRRAREPMCPGNRVWGRVVCGVHAEVREAPVVLLSNPDDRVPEFVSAEPGVSWYTKLRQPLHLLNPYLRTRAPFASEGVITLR